MGQLQQLSLMKKKMILWGVVIIVSLIMLFFWLKDAKEKLQNIPAGGFQEIIVPPIDIPQMSQPDIAVPPELQEELDKLEKQNNEENKTNQ
ncbi:MAG: hypothetical protein V1905_01955 [bacterium]